MTIKYLLDAKGGFTAEQAKRRPESQRDIAAWMLKGQVRHGLTNEADYDARNWETLGGEP